MKLQAVDFPKLNSTLSDTDRERLIAKLSRNIQTVFDAATDAEIIDGLAWYANARGYAYTLAKRFDYPLETIAAVIAALSPSCGWSRNKLDALTVLLAHTDGKQPSDVKVSTYNKNKEKAFAILESARAYANNPRVKQLQSVGGFGSFQFDAFKLLGGLKTRAFANNIACAESTLVTIDFHAASVARGIRQTTQNAKALSANQYAVLVEAYRNAARTLNLRPYELQAVVWCAWRRLHSVHAMHG